MQIVIRAALVYVFVYIVLRALGRRELGELTSFELVLLFVVGDLVQQSITANDTSITAAVLAISTIALLILVQGYVVFRWPRTRPLLEGTPVVVLVGGEPIKSVLRRERMTLDEVRESARKQGIASLADIKIAILEADGKLSFLTYDRAQPSGESGHSLSA
jgi:uncharacterized membrane protein YcaP (DUF421 family)